MPPIDDLPPSHGSHGSHGSHLLVRPETPADHDAVYAIVAAAFEQEDEAKLVNALRAAGAAEVSLVAEINGKVGGHILFSPVTIESEPAAGPVAGLAPVSVAPAYQRAGIGSALSRAGLEACKANGYVGCVVLGHADYYPKFGFAPAHTQGLRCEYDCPPEHFMAMALIPGGLDGAAGLVQYHPVFSEVS